jgi:hypothetical protein
VLCNAVGVSVTCVTEHIDNKCLLHDLLLDQLVQVAVATVASGNQPETDMTGQNWQSNHIITRLALALDIIVMKPAR